MERFKLSFEGVSVRFVREEEKPIGVGVLDLLEAAGFKSPTGAWSRGRKLHPELDGDAYVTSLGKHPVRRTRGEALPLLVADALLLAAAAGTTGRGETTKVERMAKIQRLRTWLLQVEGPASPSEEPTAPAAEPAQGPAQTGLLPLAAATPAAPVAPAEPAPEVFPAPPGEVLPAASPAPAPLSVATPPRPAVHLEASARYLEQATTLRREDPELAAVYLGLARAHLRREEEQIVEAKLAPRALDPERAQFGASDVVRLLKGQVQLGQVITVAQKAGVCADELHGVPGLSEVIEQEFGGKPRPWMLYTLRGIERIGEYLRTEAGRS